MRRRLGKRFWRRGWGRKRGEIGEGGDKEKGERESRGRRRRVEEKEEAKRGREVQVSVLVELRDRGRVLLPLTLCTTSYTH